MPQWRVHFFVVSDNQHFSSELVVSASDRTGAVRIVEAMYGGQVRIRWVEML